MTLSKTSNLKQGTDDKLLFNHVSAKLSELDIQMICSIPPGGNWQDIPLKIAKLSVRLMKLRENGGRTTYYGRLRSDLPSYTINTFFNRPGNGTFIHPEQNRLISYREAARLQSFPDNYKFLGSNSSIFKQIGNAVPPLLAKAIGSQYKKGKVVDVFSGAGGISQGFSDAGHQIIVSADNNPNMRETYSFNHPNTTVVASDFSNPFDVESFIELVDSTMRGKTIGILVGGPPCQGFSTAGKWDLNDSRNRLVFSMLRVVKHLRPETVVIENVVGLRIQKKGETLLSIQENLKSLGYESEWFLLNSVQYGVPQRRRRVFIVASHSGNLKGPPETSFSALRMKRRNQEMQLVSPGKARPISVQDAIGDLPAIETGGGEQEIYYDPEWAISPYQRYIRGKVSFDELIKYQSG